ncbi:MAG: hypothetical protein R3C56_40530 [Pirellulaceae bacterium]
MSTIQSEHLAPHFDTAGFESFISARQEPDWLLDLRKQSWQQFEQSAWPDRKQEEWMRSDLRGFKLDRYRLPVVDRPNSAETVSIPRRLEEGITPAGALHSLDGRIDHESLQSQWADKGVVFGDLSRLAAEHSELVQQHLFSVVDPEQDRFAKLHAAAWSGGQLLYVPRGVCVSQPLYISAGMSDGGSDTGIPWS